ncbi:MAG: DNA polymerase III subunit epsilon [Gammaproteobacteria bacterium RIFCSPHIGHO2_12_FULL_41_20]|nr:MAG: DNA polymerase III subunit epsilon [Gammaproteobacteria bacterium RIFCSPHIGHO2_12_FULL_41_20]
MRQVVLDTETTGIHVHEGHRIIEIGCVELVNRKLTGKTYHQYINPQREVDAGALAVHGLTSTFLLDKPLFVDISQEFMSFIRGAELIIHNAPFDVGFINCELALTKKDWKTIAEYCRIIDTLQLARQLHVGQRNNLDALCKRYNIDNSQRELHGALLDAYLLTQVYLAMTGGQGSLFDAWSEGKDNVVEKKTDYKASLEKVYSLRTLFATDEEKREHENYLQNMAKQKNCRWLE